MVLYRKIFYENDIDGGVELSFLRMNVKKGIRKLK